MTQCRFRDERGQALVEYSLVLLLILTVLFGVIEVSRLMLTYTTLAQAAADGVRYAVSHGADRFGGGTDGFSGPGCGAGVAPNVANVVTNEANAAGLNTANLTVTVCYTPGNAIGDTVTVTANYNYTPIVAFIGLASTINLTGKTAGTITY